MILRSLQFMGRRQLAAAWFALFGLLAASALFLRPATRITALCLYVFLPTLSAGIAGYLWGWAILDSAATKSHISAMLRGAGVAGGAFVIFTVLFTIGLPIMERGWSVTQSVGILVATLTLGLLMVGPLILLLGMVAGVTLYQLLPRSCNRRH